MKLNIDIEQVDILIKALRVRELVMAQCEADGYDVTHELVLIRDLIETLENQDDSNELLPGWIIDDGLGWYTNLDNGGLLFITYDDNRSGKYEALVINSLGRAVASKSGLNWLQGAMRWAEARWGQLPLLVWSEYPYSDQKQ